MVKRKLRIAGSMLAVALCTGSMLSGCGGGTASDGAESRSSVKPSAEAAKSAKPDPGALDKKLTIKWLGSFKEVQNDNYVEKKIQDKFNVEIEPMKVFYGDKEQVNMLLASGEKWNIMLYDGDAIKLQNSGALREIPLDMIRKYAPHYAKVRDENPIGWKYNRVPGKTDSYYALNGYAANVMANTALPFVRLDWLENLNMVPDGIKYLNGSDKIAILEKPLPYEQYEKMLVAFKQNDPDKTGKHDTYALAGGKNPSNPMAAFEQILGTFGLAQSSNLIEDGKLIAPYMSKNYKEFLKLLNKYYKDGLIDPEFATDNVQKYWGKIVEGKVGSGMLDYDYADMNLYKDRPPSTLFAKNPKAKILYLRFPVNGKGVGGGSPNLSPFVGSYVISKDTTDEELIRILQIFDAINYDKDLVIATRFGEEGKTYQVADGVTKLKDGINAKEYGFYYFNLYTYEKWYLPFLYGPATLEMLDKMASKNDGAKPVKIDIEGNTKEVNAKYSPAVNTIANTFAVKAVMGTIDIDKEWDGYVKSIYDAGYDKIAADMEKFGTDYKN